MFLLNFIVIALPGAVIVLIIAAGAAHWLKLMPQSMSFSWLAIPTMGLAAGGATMALMVEELAIRPLQLQSELLGAQIVTPIELRGYRFWGVIMDPGWAWVYEIDPATATRLTSGCRPDPNPRVHWCDIAGTLDQDAGGADGRGAFVRVEGTTLTIQEYFY